MSGITILSLILSTLQIIMIIAYICLEIRDRRNRRR